MEANGSSRLLAFTKKMEDLLPKWESWHLCIDQCGGTGCGVVLMVQLVRIHSIVGVVITVVSVVTTLV